MDVIDFLGVDAGRKRRFFIDGQETAIGKPKELTGAFVTKRHIRAVF